MSDSCEECGITLEALTAAGRQLYTCDAPGCGADCCSTCSEDSQVPGEAVVCLKCAREREAVSGRRTQAVDERTRENCENLPQHTKDLLVAQGRIDELEEQLATARRERDWLSTEAAKYRKRAAKWKRRAQEAALDFYEGFLIGHKIGQVLRNPSKGPPK